MVMVILDPLDIWNEAGLAFSALNLARFTGGGWNSGAGSHSFVLILEAGGLQSFVLIFKAGGWDVLFLFNTSDVSAVFLMSSCMHGHHPCLNDQSYSLLVVCRPQHRTGVWPRTLSECSSLLNQHCLWISPNVLWPGGVLEYHISSFGLCGGVKCKAFAQWAFGVITFKQLDKGVTRIIFIAYWSVTLLLNNTTFQIGFNEWKRTRHSPSQIELRMWATG